MIQIHAFKKKEKEEGRGKTPTWWSMQGSKLGGRWKVLSLVAGGRFSAWWPMEGFKLGGQWKVPSLVVLGMFHIWWSMGKHLV